MSPEPADSSAHPGADAAPGAAAVSAARRIAAAALLAVPAAASLPLLWLGGAMGASAWLVGVAIVQLSLLWLAVHEALRLLTPAIGERPHSPSPPGDAVTEVPSVAEASTSPDEPADEPAETGKSPAHAFNNHMMTIRVSADLLRMESGLEPGARKVVEELDVAATAAATLVREVLTSHARAPSGKAAPGAADTSSVPAAESEAKASRSAASADSTEGTILLAEDESAVLATMKLALETAGFTVLAASSAADALAAAEAHEGPIDMLCTDAGMPGMHVTEFMRAFLERFPGRPVLVCSGDLEEELAAAGLAQLPHAFLSKPFSVNDLLAIVRPAIARQRLRRPTS